MTWDMQTQLKKGKTGEEWLLANWPCPLRRHELARGPDFVDAKKRIIELKTDSYLMADTSNFFIERWSSQEAQTPGSVWQAIGKGCTTFVYLFIKDQVYFRFDDLPALARELDSLILGLKPFPVRNRGWTTVGFRVARTDLKHLYKEVKVK